MSVIYLESYHTKQQSRDSIILMGFGWGMVCCVRHKARNFQQQKPLITINQQMNQSGEESGSSEGSEQGAADTKTDLLDEKFREILENHPDLTGDQAFYLEYCKLYIDTVRKANEVGEITRELKRLRGLSDAQPSRARRNTSQHLSNETSNSERRKRIRRTANEIARHYVCQVQKCQKSYGSQGSLNQHIKLKHPHLLDNHET